MIRKTKIRLMPRDEPLSVAIAHAGVTQTQIAKDIGVDPRTLNQVINGNKMSAVMAQKLADYFNRDINDLFFAVDLRNPPIDDQSRSHAA